jgi:DNA invertase Pin-like site-specific DNA recombinase
MIRFAWYGRVSSTDRQDPALSFPSQLAACRRKATELGGVVTCEFTDQLSGAKADRPGWAALVTEARRVTARRFDSVVIYATSRLARDRLYAALFERELQNVGVSIYYAVGAGDPATPEGMLFIGMQQLWDEFERLKLARETRRGMRELVLQGYRAGGRAPYGYSRISSEVEGKLRVTLEPNVLEAPVVLDIFTRHAYLLLGFKRIARYLNRPGGPPSPEHVDSQRNLTRSWTPGTVRAMLLNRTYTGAAVWNRLDFATARLSGGGARARPHEEWVICEGAHEPIVSLELFEAVQARFRARART